MIDLITGVPGSGMSYFSLINSTPRSFSSQKKEKKKKKLNEKMYFHHKHSRSIHICIQHTPIEFECEILCTHNFSSRNSPKGPRTQNGLYSKCLTKVGL